MFVPHFVVLFLVFFFFLDIFFLSPSFLTLWKVNGEEGPEKRRNVTRGRTALVENKEKGKNGEKRGSQKKKIKRKKRRKIRKVKGRRKTQERKRKTWKNGLNKEKD